MDDIVKAALAKWPDVPHCTGWLLLDRRGQWRMRDEAAQQQGALGTPVRHAALLGFINRNYECDEQGQWFFQNGPQRVYVELAYAPWVVRLALDASGTPTLTDQTGRPFAPSAGLVDDEGGVLLVDTSQPARVALLHDHDLDLFADLAHLEPDGCTGRLAWRADATLPLSAIHHADVARRFGFVASPANARLADTARPA
ncbi:DUF2946 family protein [Trinickia fusca]|uniref:DUF2946 family protein n=1 Tax=Trinickia fusca TaxID=2419777 RepID=A0A494XH13_9BURK|nr:DUF2946 family protein [Trinickia fusca]RKP49082.1 DUF2946 family protein [Trinickia fusca]